MATLKFGKFKGQEFDNTPQWYRDWLLKQDWFKMPSGDLQPPPRPKSWDGHSRKGQAWEDAHFDYESKMADKYDPIPDMYNHLT